MNALDKQLAELDRDMSKFAPHFDARPRPAFTSGLNAAVLAEARRIAGRRIWLRRLTPLAGLAAAVALLAVLRPFAAGVDEASEVRVAWTADSDPGAALDAWLTATDEASEQLTRATTSDWSADALENIDVESLSPEDWQRSFDESFEALAEVLGA